MPQVNAFIGRLKKLKEERNEWKFTKQNNDFAWNLEAYFASTCSAAWLKVFLKNIYIYVGKVEVIDRAQNPPGRWSTSRP